MLRWNMRRLSQKGQRHYRKTGLWKRSPLGSKVQPACIRRHRGRCLYPDVRTKLLYLKETPVMAGHSLMGPGSSQANGISPQIQGEWYHTSSLKSTMAKVIAPWSLQAWPARGSQNGRKAEINTAVHKTYVIQHRESWSTEQEGEEQTLHSIEGREAEPQEWRGSSARLVANGFYFLIIPDTDRRVHL